MKTIINKNSIWLLGLFLAPFSSFSQGQILSGETSFSNPLFNTLLGVIIFLLIVIVALSQVLKNIGQSDYVARQNQKNNNNGAKTGLMLLPGFTSFEAAAQTTSPANDWLIGGLDMFTFYFMMTVIAIEIIFLLVLFRILKKLLAIEVIKPVAAVEKKEKSIIEKLNASVEIEREEEILMDHEYDGIRELDNDLPPWWRYGFYLTILVAVIYLTHYHVTQTGDLQLAEYTKAVEKGKAEVAEFMKNAANNVDETTVTMMQGADVESGKGLFVSTCAACHGRLGEGGVGPNLADKYWMHGGSLADIFKSVKYGWPDKGMKSWKEDLTPVQIAQISSFIKTLDGTNPPNAKAQQGDLYVENSTPAVKDTTGTDTLQIK